MIDGTGKSPQSGPPLPDFESLVHRAFDGHISEADFEQFAHELRSSPSSRRFYLDYASVHALLIQSLDRDDRPTLLEDRRSRFFGLPALWTLACLTACVGIGLTARHFWNAAHDPETALPAIAAVKQDAPAVEIPAVLAQVVRVVVRQPGGGPPVLEEHRELRESDVYRLDAGMAHLKFTSGAEVVLEGPSSIRILSPLSCELLQGRMTCDVPEAAAGFLVRMPGGDVVDLGTRFGVSVGTGGQGEVAVISGRVQTYAIGNGGEAQPGPELFEGLAARINAQAGRWHPTRYNVHPFARPLGYLSGIVDYSNGVHYLSSPPRSLRSGDLESANSVFLIAEQTGVEWPKGRSIDRSVAGTADVFIDSLTEEADISKNSLAQDGAVEGDIHREGHQETIQTILATEEEPATDFPPVTRHLRSYLLHYDPPGTPVVPIYGNPQASPFDREGSITFAGPIIGLIWRQDTLQNTDALCGLEGTTYLNISARQRTLSKGSTLTVSPDGRTLNFRFLSRKQTSDPLVGIDEVRILVDMNEQEDNKP